MIPVSITGFDNSAFDAAQLPEDFDAAAFFRELSEKLERSVWAKRESGLDNRRAPSADKLVLYDPAERRFSNIVGSFRMPWNGYDVSLRIKSRVDRDIGGNAPWFLLTMLLGEDLRLFGVDAPADEEDLFYYFMLFQFRNHLETAVQKGFYKTYRRREGNDDRVRGTLEIARHIRLNAGLRNGKMAYSYREQTTDNFLNHMIIAAYEHLKERYGWLTEELIDRNSGLKKALDDLKYTIKYAKTDSYRLIEKNARPITHPYFTEYEALRRICMRVLRDEGLPFYGEEEDPVQGFLFYLPDLWENFLEKKVFADGLGGLFPEAQASQRLTGYQVLTEERGPWLRLAPKTEGGTWLRLPEEKTAKIRPDFVLFADSDRRTPRVVLDAKFKPRWEENRTARADYEKCFRDMFYFGAESCGVILPEVRENSRVERRTVTRVYSRWRKETCPFFVARLGIPPAEDGMRYAEWRNAFEEEISAFREKLSEELRT